MSTTNKIGKIHPTSPKCELDGTVKSSDRRRRHSNGGSSFSSPRTPTNNNNNNNSSTSIRSPKTESSRKQIFHGIDEKGGSGSSSVISPRAPLVSRAASYADGDSKSVSRARSGSFSFRPTPISSPSSPSPLTPSLRKSLVRKTRRVKHVTFRSPLTEYEPSNRDISPIPGESEYSESGSLLLDEDLKRRQEFRKRRREERLQRQGSSSTSLTDPHHSHTIHCCGTSSCTLS